MKRKIPYAFSSEDVKKIDKDRAISKQFFPSFSNMAPVVTKRGFSAALYEGTHKSFFRYLPIHYMSKTMQKKTVTTLQVKERSIATRELQKMAKNWSDTRIEGRVRKYEEKVDAPINWQLPERREHLINRIIPYLTANPL